MELFLNLGKQFKRCCFEMIIFLALAAILFSKPGPYGQIRKQALHLYEINWNNLCNFGRGHYGELYLIWTRSSGVDVLFFHFYFWWPFFKMTFVIPTLF